MRTACRVIGSFPFGKLRVRMTSADCLLDVCEGETPSRQPAGRRRYGRKPGYERTIGYFALESLMRTMSVSVWPRRAAIFLPSGEAAKSKIWSDLKVLICLGSPPAMGCDQMLATPSLVRPMSSDLPSAENLGLV